MADTSKERNKRGKRGPWAAPISDAEKAGKRVKSLTMTFTFEEPDGTAESGGKQMSDTDAELAEFEKRMRDGKA